LFIGKIPVEIHIFVKGSILILRQKNTLFIIFLLVTMLAFLPTLQPEEPPAQAIEPQQLDMASELTTLLQNSPDLKGSLAGVSVRSAETGELLFEHIGDTRLQPASVLKLFTASAALSVLGEDYTFTTELLTDGKIKNETLIGSLFLKGKGDPTLIQSDFDKFASDLKAMGINRIAGDLIADDTWYDDIRYSMDLTWNDEHEYYGSQVSALTASPNKDYDSGTVILNIHPAKKQGKEASISLEPATDYIKVVNNTLTVAAKGEKNIKIKREHGGNTVTVTGTIPIKAKPMKEWLAVWEPSMYAINLLEDSLTKQGIKVVGKIKHGSAPDKLKQLISHKSMPLSKLLIPFMKLSNNGHAEVLVKEMGKVVHDDGSWEKGLEAMNSEIERFGINTDQLVVRDGSGISHANLIPANVVTGLLYQAQKEKWFPSFKNSLPVAGASDRMTGGTLRSRMKSELLKENVIAKTGSLTGVSTLAGYVKTENGKDIIFAVLLNNLLDEKSGKKVQDQLVEILASQP
jgi:serine-type D-Ala-D-Ala carboxypeptidase/endopeptidase (penicillin-binding protein 4)